MRAHPGCSRCSAAGAFHSLRMDVAGIRVGFQGGFVGRVEGIANGNQRQNKLQSGVLCRILFFFFFLFSPSIISAVISAPSIEHWQHDDLDHDVKRTGYIYLRGVW